MSTEIDVEEAERQELLKAQLRLSIGHLKREREYHERRLRTLTLAIDAMDGELALIGQNWRVLPPEIKVAFDKVKETYRKEPVLAKSSPCAG